jgi:hypothetical protein
VEAARRLAGLAALSPSETFATALEARFLAAARQQSAEVPVAAGNDTPTLPSRLSPMPAPGEDQLPTLPDADLGVTVRGREPRRGRRLPQRLWPVVAAACVLAALLSTFTVAAFASPGSALYSLNRWEQGVRAKLAGSQADQARLHLQLAGDALRALDHAVAPPVDEAAYHDALATFADEFHAAGAVLDMLPAGVDRETLAAGVSDLGALARHDLRAALPVLGWPDRLQTTATLAEVGDAVPRVTGVTITRVSQHGAHLWRCAVVGSGFAPGAVLLVDGRQMGTVTSSTPTTLTAEVPMDDDAGLPRSMGIGNPDGTASTTTNISGYGGGGDDGSPTPSATSDDHGGSSGSGSGSGDGGHDGGGSGTGTNGTSGGSGSGGSGSSESGSHSGVNDDGAHA